MNKLPAIMLLATGLTACATTPPARVVPEAEGVEPVSGLKMSCKKPWVLTQDCSGFSGPKKLLDIGGVRFKVAGSDDGRTTVLFGGTNVVNQGTVSDPAFNALKWHLEEKSIGIESVTPIVSSGQVMGYAVITDKPAYVLWDAFSAE